MTSELAVSSEYQARLRNEWLSQLNTILVAVISGALCVTSQLKIAEVQLLEIIYALDIAVLFLWFLLHPGPLLIFRPFAEIGRRWAIVSVFALLLSIYGLRQNFYIENASPLKQPFIITLARVGELFLDVFFMLYLASQYRINQRLCRIGALTYFVVGIAGSLYAIISAVFPSSYFFGSYDYGRLRGFNNEGGSYGTYVMTLIFLTFALRHKKWISSPVAYLSQLLFISSLIGSRSKAAFGEVALFFVLAPALRLRGKVLLAAVFLSALTVAVIFYVADVPAKLKPYTDAINSYRTLSLLRPSDGNYIVGRAAGLFFAPAMIKAHPFAGIGLGNYPIVRDDPEYRRGTPVEAPALDSPSLGPIDYIVDLGFPLFIYFTWTELAPAAALVRRRENFGLVCLLLMQPVANWFGAHLNLTYPWVGAAIALGIAYSTPNTGADSDVRPVSSPLSTLGVSS